MTRPSIERPQPRLASGAGAVLDSPQVSTLVRNEVSWMIDEHVVDKPSADHESTFDRQELLRRGAAASLAVPSISLLFGAGDAFARTSARALTPTFYQWIYNIHPDIPGVLNKQYGKTHKLDAKIAPVQGFGIERF